MELKAYIGGIPNHVHINVPPGTAAVDYIEDGVVVAIVIHDIASLDEIAKSKDATLTRVDIGEPVLGPEQVAAANTAAEVKGEPELDEAVEPSTEWAEMSFSDLKKFASEGKIKGRSAMDKDQLIEALSG